MRTPTLQRLLAALSVAVVSAVLAACGGPSQDVAAVRAAHYKGDAAQMFAAAVNAVNAEIKVAKGDQAKMGFQTIARWYAPDGSVAAEDGADMRTVPNNSLSIVWNVVFRPDGDAYLVDVKPLMVKYIAGSPKPQPITEDDPYIPGWVGERHDKLANELHDALKQWEVPTVPGNVPGAAPAPAAAAAPAGSGEAAPAAAPAGSAAPAPAAAQ